MPAASESIGHLPQQRSPSVAASADVSTALCECYKDADNNWLLSSVVIDVLLLWCTRKRRVSSHLHIAWYSSLRRWYWLYDVWTRDHILFATHAFNPQVEWAIRDFTSQPRRELQRCNQDFSEHELTFTFVICCRLSVCLSVVCNARALYSDGWNFRKYFYWIWYLGNPLTSTENFTEIVLGESLRQGS